MPTKAHSPTRNRGHRHKEQHCRVHHFGLDPPDHALIEQSGHGHLLMPDAGFPEGTATSHTTQIPPDTRHQKRKGTAPAPVSSEQYLETHHCTRSTPWRNAVVWSPRQSARTTSHPPGCEGRTSTHEPGPAWPEPIPHRGCQRVNKPTPHGRFRSPPGCLQPATRLRFRSICRHHQPYRACALASDRVAPARAASAAAMKSSRAPSRTASGLPFSTPVRRSFTN